MISLKKIKTTQSVFAPFALGATALFMMVGCGSDDESSDSETVEATFSSLKTNLFSACSTCHNGGNQEVNEVLATDIAVTHTGFTATNIQFASNASGENTTCAGSQAKGLKLVTPGNVKTSVILALVDSSSRDSVSDAIGCGVTNSHHTNATISGLATADVVAALKTWISEGAKNN